MRGFQKKFAQSNFFYYLCIPEAEVAQLVEHNLAKVGVAGSSPVFRSSRDAMYCVSTKKSHESGIFR